MTVLGACEVQLCAVPLTAVVWRPLVGDCRQADCAPCVRAFLTCLPLRHVRVAHRVTQNVQELQKRLHLRLLWRAMATVRWGSR